MMNTHEILEHTGMKQNVCLTPFQQGMLHDPHFLEDTLSAYKKTVQEEQEKINIHLEKMFADLSDSVTKDDPVQNRMMA